MKKIKELMKSYLPGFLIGIISTGIIVVYAETYFPSINTTYDNTNTELKSENVQDAIDELYGVCFAKSAGDQILEDQPLEKDPYECRYFFTGKNPNNYITFNGEDAGWKIISVECDGRIKIIKDTSIGNYQWDSDGSNTWNSASLNTYLNVTYYNKLTNTAKNQIIASDFSIGALHRTETNLSVTVNNENKVKWTGKIALPTASEYIRTNSDKSNCGTMDKVYNSINCGDTSWMHNIDAWWTLSADTEFSGSVFFVEDGFLFNEYSDFYELSIKPTIYLSSNIKITGGTGTESNPYKIA